MFSAVRPLLYAGVAVLRILPRFVALGLWYLVNGWPGPLGAGLRWMAAKRLAAGMGDNVSIGPDVEIRAWQHLLIGHNVSIHRFCYIDASGSIEIGNDVSIAHSSSILSTNHRWADGSVAIRDNPVSYQKVVIGQDVWIGCGVRILAGVTLGRRVVVAAGGVVTKSAPDGVVLGGVPAKPISSTELANERSLCA